MKIHSNIMQMFFKSKIFRVATIFITAIFFFPIARADSSYGNEVGQATSLGQASLNAIEPIGIFTGVLYDLCYILGTAFVLGSFIRYKEHRNNPSQTPISRPIMLCIFGLILLAVPFLTQLSASSKILGV